MAVDEGWVALGVVADEVKWRAGAAGGGVFSVGAVVKELAQHSFRTAGVNTGGGGTADKGAGNCFEDGRGGQVIEAVVLLRRTVPVGDVRLVPDFPVPVGSLCAVTLAEVRGVGKDQPGPLGPVVGRVAPAGEKGAVWEMVTVGVGMRGECLGHEADLHDGANVRRGERVEDAVGDGPVVDG